jgi:hypothetical protein
VSCCGPTDGLEQLRAEAIVRRTRREQFADEQRSSVEVAVGRLIDLARETQTLERRVSDIVNAAFGLTPAEVALMWDTAPPRMPIAHPPGA